MPDSLEAGVARVVITPPVGIGLVGFAGRGPSNAVHDELYATAVVLKSADAQTVLISVDLLGVGEEMVSEVRREIEARTTIPAENVLICATHTHYGPSAGGYDGPEKPADSVAYQRNLVYLLAGCARWASENCRPVILGTGTGRSQIGVNRRERRPDGQIVLGQNSDGPCDREVRLLRIDSDEGEPVALFVNFACHPVCQSWSTRRISADYIAAMRQRVEDETGTRVLFLQGASGNINPIEMQPAFEPARTLGLRLADAVLAAYESIHLRETTDLMSARSNVELPALTFATVGEGKEALAALSEEVARLRARNPNGGALWWAEHRLEGARRRLESLQERIPLPPINAEMAAVRIGNAALVTAPGEIFTETGMSVTSASPFTTTLFTGYTNGVVGYVPTAEAYAEGGYEVTHACRVDPGAAALIERTAVDLLRSLR